MYISLNSDLAGMYINGLGVNTKPPKKGFKLLKQAAEQDDDDDQPKAVEWCDKDGVGVKQKNKETGNGWKKRQIKMIHNPKWYYWAICIMIAME